MEWKASILPVFPTLYNCVQLIYYRLAFSITHFRVLLEILRHAHFALPAAIRVIIVHNGTAAVKLI